MSTATRHRKAFRDIVKGFSPAELDENTVYIKHLTPHDQVELEDVEGHYYRIAERRGLPTEEEMLLFLEQEGDWTKEDELGISKLEGFIESLQKSKSSLVLKSAQDQQSEIIKKEQEKLNKKLQQKRDLLGNTCEEYGKNRAHDFYILQSFYSDAKLLNPLYSQDQYNNLTQPEISNLIAIYNEVFSAFTEESIQYMVLEEFYSPYLGFAEDSMQFYGKPFCELTYNQVRMIVYTRIFKNIFDIALSKLSGVIISPKLFIVAPVLIVFVIKYSEAEFKVPRILEPTVPPSSSNFLFTSSSIFFF